MPEIFTDWSEWRETYALCRREYIGGHIERTRARAMLASMGYKLHDATAELDLWETEKGKSHADRTQIVD